MKVSFDWKRSLFVHDFLPARFYIEEAGVSETPLASTIINFFTFRNWTICISEIEFDYNSNIKEWKKHLLLD